MKPFHKFSLFFILIFITHASYAQYNLQWHFKNEGASNGAIYNNIYFYPNGDAFISGYNHGGDLDPGPGFNNSGTTNGQNFIARYTSGGNLVFARPLFYSGNTSTYLYSEFLDNDENYFFVFTGSDGTYDLDTSSGPGVGEITISNNTNAFVKLDSNGLYQGSFSYPGNFSIFRIRILPDKSILISGEVDGGGDFDPGPGVFSPTAANGYQKAFIAKFDSTLNFIDAKVFEGTGFYPNGVYSNSLEVDGLGNIIFTGSYIGTIDFDPGPGVANSYWNGGIAEKFVVKLNSSLNLDTFYLFSSAMNNPQTFTDPDDNVYFFGESPGNTDVEPGAGVTLINNSTSGSVYYMAKYDSSFNLIWVKSFDNDDMSCGRAKFGPSGTIDFLMAVSDTINNNGFGLPELIPQIANSYPGSFYLIALDTSGTAVHSIQLGVTSQLVNAAAAFSDANHFYFAGRIMDTLDIQVGPGITYESLPPGMGSNFFLSYYSMDASVSQARGNVFYDENGNNIKDSTENGLQGIVVEIMPGNYHVSTSNSGNYGAYFTPGNYSISIPSYPVNFQPPLPSAHNATFTIGNQLDTANNFAFQLDLSRQDMETYLTLVGATRPGFPLKYVLTVTNSGGNTQSGTVDVLLDSYLTFLNASLIPSAVAGNSLSWNYTNVGPFQTFNIDVYARVDSLATIGDTILSSAVVYPLASDIDTTNNFDGALSFVTGSFDPNDKRSEPENIIPLAFVQNGNFIEYTIRFQNLGNDTAFNVVILDTLSNLLDIGSFDIVSASHSYEFNLYPSRLLEIRMQNILLPDSATDEVNSNGFVKYKLRAKNNLLSESIITNTAHIYFDFNQPVTTNTSILEVVDFTSLSEFVTSTSQVDVYPNPSSGIVTVSFKNKNMLSGEISICDLHGRQVLEKKLFSGYKTTLNLQPLKNGMYILKAIESNGTIHYARVVVESAF